MNQIEIYQTEDGSANVEVHFKSETLWLNQKQMAELFDKDTDTIGLHLKNIYMDGELQESATTEFFSVVQLEGRRKVSRKVKYYNLEAIISVGYRVNSKKGTKFRQWATSRLNNYLLQGYILNESRLQQKSQELQDLKVGIRILERALLAKADDPDFLWLNEFSAGLKLLDDYDHETLDASGITTGGIKYPTYDEYIGTIKKMRSEFKSKFFGRPKDDSFMSAIEQVRQSFDGEDLYKTIEEKAAVLLYLVVKNHAFIDGNKRIAAACFLKFLDKNKRLITDDGTKSISNDALAALTLFVASSKSDEMNHVIKLIISVLNRSFIMTP